MPIFVLLLKPCFGMNLADIRTDYSKLVLVENNIEKNPIKQFELWMDDAIQNKVLEPNAFVLSTLDHNGVDSRVLLLKGLNTEGLVFFTNYESAKGKQIDVNPVCSMNFFWAELQRQVRVKGRIVKVSATESDEYFYSRPIESQIGAHVSHQSQKIADRKELDDQISKKISFYETQKVDRPEHWGGYVVIPDYFEFWQGRPSRLHDRIAFEKVNGSWDMSRLQP